jgi:hypothetical protein
MVHIQLGQLLYMPFGTFHIGFCDVVCHFSFIDDTVLFLLNLLLKWFLLRNSNAVLLEQTFQNFNALIASFQDVLGLLGNTVVCTKFIVQILVHLVTFVDLGCQLHQYLVLFLKETDVHTALELLLL